MNSSHADVARGGDLVASVDGRAGADRKKVTNRRILATVAVVATLVHVSQVVSGGHPWAGIVSFGLAAAFVVGWRLELLRAVRTAVVLICTLCVACILGTLTVQRSQLSHASPEEFGSTSAFAWAHLAIKVTHPLPAKVEPDPEQELRLERLEAAFGTDLADEERKKLHKSLVARHHEAMAQELASAHPQVFAGLLKLAESLLLTDVFHAWWFISLFYLLSLNLVVGALARRKLSLRNLGFHAAHLGLVLVVLGATIGGFLGRRGFVPLRVGTASSVFTDRGDGSEVPLGFSVRLDDFETLYHEDLVIEAASSGGSGAHHAMMGGGADALSHNYKLEEGQVISVTDPDTGDGFELHMLEISQSAGLGRSMEAVEAGQGDPAVRLALPGAPDEGVWISGHETVFVDPDNRFKLRLERSMESEPGATPCPEERLGKFTFEVEDSGPLVVPVAVGYTVDLGEFEATFLDVTPSFRVGDAATDPLAYPRNPAARVRIVDGEGQAGEFLFFADPQLRDFTELPWKGVRGTFDYDYWCAPTRARVLLVVDSRGAARATLAASPVAEESTLDLSAGADLAHPALPEGMRITEILPNARSTVRPVAAAPGDGDAHTSLRLGIEGPDGESSERWLVSNTASGILSLGEGGLTLRLADNRVRPPRDWRSHLAILEEGEVVKEGVAEVNGPVVFGGYAFFQSDADPNRPDYSGLQVVRDPAWLPVKTGLWLLLLGISWVFYVQPLMDRMSKKGPRSSGEKKGGTP